MTDSDDAWLEWQREVMREQADLECRAKDCLAEAHTFASLRFDEDYAYQYHIGLLTDWRARNRVQEPKERRPYSKTPIPEHLRWEVWSRDGFRCQQCGTDRLLSVDHVHPEKLGGPTTLDNLQTLCRSCNSRKGTKVA